MITLNIPFRRSKKLDDDGGPNSSNKLVEPSQKCAALKTNVSKLKEKNQYFSLYEFLTEQPCRYTASCIDFCVVYRLKRSDFLSLLSGKDLEIFNMMKDQVLNRISFDCEPAQDMVLKQRGKRRHSRIVTSTSKK